MVDRLRIETKERLNCEGSVVVFGASGMVGSRFVEMFGGENVITPTSSELDITNKEALEKFIDRYKPKFIVNFSAYTNLNKSEEQKDNKSGDCWQINVEGVRNILDMIDPEQTHFTQISTNMVLNASLDDPGPYKESHL